MSSLANLRPGLVAAALCFALSAATGARAEPASQAAVGLVGSWEGKIVLPEQSLNSLSPEQQQTIKQKLGQVMFKIEFAGDGGFSSQVILAGQKDEATGDKGTWKVVHADDKSITVETVDAQKRTEKVELDLEGPDQFRLHPPLEENAPAKGMYFQFRRVSGRQSPAAIRR